MIKLDISLLIILLLLFLFLFYYGKIELILSLLLIVILIIFKDELLDKIKRKEKKTEIIEHNRKINRITYNDDEINSIMKKLKKYKKYNPEAYNNGKKYMVLFLDNIRKLSSFNLKSPKLDFENAEYNLKKSLNNFQSITISVPENSYKNSIETGDYTKNKYGSKISKLCKELYKYCYSLLYKLSLKVNDDWMKNPNIFKSEIIYDSGNVKPVSSYSSDIDLY